MSDMDRATVTKMRNGGHQLARGHGAGLYFLPQLQRHGITRHERPRSDDDLPTAPARMVPELHEKSGRFQAGHIMPSYWPGGKAVQPAILDGDTEKQLQALWYTFHWRSDTSCRVSIR